MEELFQYCADRTGLEKSEVEAVINVFLDKIVETLSQGNTVDLGDDFGVFTVKLRTGSVPETSPRTPKASSYRTIFRENKGMRRRLKVPGDTAEAETVFEEP